jgi:hypothetical protein
MFASDATLSQRQMFQNELRRQLGLFAAASSIAAQ